MAIILTAILKLHGSPVIAQGAPQEYAQLHLGMKVRLVLHAAPAHADSAARAAFARIAALEQILSDWRPESEVRRLGERGGAPTPVSETLFEVTARARAMSRASAGAFDPTVAPLVALWRQARATGRAPSESATIAARARVGWSRMTLDWSRRTITLPRGMQLDLGGIAKGWILGEAGRVLQLQGINSYLIEAGGDLLLGDAPPGEAGWRVEVSTRRGDSVLTLRRIAVATSGPSEQFALIDGVRHSHVIDPRSGRPLRTPFAITVLHPDPATADALATAITVLGEDEGSRLAARHGATMIRRRD
jgi:thiamine biosynthesis lipoprotein